MKTVHKYTLEPGDYVDILLPAGAETLHVGEQAGKLCLWALVDPGKPLKKRTFRVAGTGHVIRENGLTYIGTAIIARGALVFHVFQVGS